MDKGLMFLLILKIKYELMLALPHFMISAAVNWRKLYFAYPSPVSFILYLNLPHS